MSDPINGINGGKLPIPPNGSRSAPAGKGAASSTAQAGQSQDVVSLTNAAESLQELEKTLASDAQISSEKVAAIKSALSSGEYKVDPDKVAEKFMEVERALGKI